MSSPGQEGGARPHSTKSQKTCLRGKSGVRFLSTRKELSQICAAAAVSMAINNAESKNSFCSLLYKVVQVREAGIHLRPSGMEVLKK